MRWEPRIPRQDKEDPVLHKYKRFRDEMADLLLWFVLLVIYVMAIPLGN
jgi:hypothetical protein